MLLQMGLLLCLGPNVITDMTVFTWLSDITCHVTKWSEKKVTGKISQNLGVAISLSFGKFITGYETCF